MGRVIASRSPFPPAVPHGAKRGSIASTCNCLAVRLHLPIALPSPISRKIAGPPRGPLGVNPRLGAGPATRSVAFFSVASGEVRPGDWALTGQDFGTRARSFTAALCFGKAVTVRPITTDRYRRTVAAVVLPDGRLLNHEIVRAGYAWWYRSYAPGDAVLDRLEREARAARLGLWSQPNPIPPWEWRRPKRETAPAAAEGKVIANRRSFVYHRPGCPNAARISPKNRMTFGSPAEAEAAGYRPGKDCH